MYRKKEDNVKLAIAEYLKYQYPNIPFTMQWDHLNLSIGVAKKLKRMRCSIANFVWPDMFIASPDGLDHYCGLFLEIKKDISEVYTKQDTIRKNKQIIKEYKSLKILKNLGYQASFTWSVDHARSIINNYFLQM
jgi:hypothetical protein